MTEATREGYQWRKAKTSVIVKYVDDHTKLFAEIAGRGFLALPGYAADAENGLELTTKMNLSEINQKILSETIERELKQQGLDYNLAVKNAVMSWEIEKQALLGDWDAEFAGIKQGMAEKEEVSNQLAIEVGSRAIVLLEAKTSLEEQMEAHRLTLANLDETTSLKEVELATAKLATATKKLEIIPILQVIVAKELELITKEQAKAAEYAAYMAAERAVADKRGELTPHINNLAVKIGDYATNIINSQIPKEALIADEKLAQANSASARAGYQVDEINAEITAETNNQAVATARRAYRESQTDNESAILDAEKTDVDAFKTEEISKSAEILGKETVSAAKLDTDRATINTIKNAAAVESVSTISASDMGANASITNMEIRKEEQIAELIATKELTASLRHLIG